MKGIFNRKIKRSTPEVATTPKVAKYNHKAQVTYLDGTVAVIPYYWATGKDGKIFLTCGLEDGTDKVTILDMKNEVSELKLM